MLTLLAPAVLDGHDQEDAGCKTGKDSDKDEMNLGIEVESAKDILEAFMQMKLPAPAEPLDQNHAGEAAKQPSEKNVENADAKAAKVKIEVEPGAVVKAMPAPSAEGEKRVALALGDSAPATAPPAPPAPPLPADTSAAAGEESMTAPAPSLASAAAEVGESKTAPAQKLEDPVPVPVAQPEKPSAQAQAAAAAEAILAQVPTPAKTKSEPIEPLVRNADAVAAAATLSEPISIIESDQEEVNSQAPTTPGPGDQSTILEEEIAVKEKEIAETAVVETAVTAEQVRRAGWQRSCICL